MTANSDRRDVMGRAIKNHILNLTPTPEKPSQLKMNTRKMFVCAKCGASFNQYAGMRIRAPGIGWCEQHSPNKKEDTNG